MRVRTVITWIAASIAGAVGILLIAALIGPRFMPIDYWTPVRPIVHMELLYAALDRYWQDVGKYPSSDQGLRALRERPEDVSQWKGPYLKKEIPVDQWGRPYVYKYPGGCLDKPDLISYGADGLPGGEAENADIVFNPCTAR